MRKLLALLAGCSLLLVISSSNVFAAGEPLQCDDGQWVVCSVFEYVDCDGASETPELCLLCSKWECYTPSTQTSE